MATSAYHMRPASSCSTTARLLPSDATIHGIYVYELNQRERGAVTRTAAALGVSKQHVSNVLRRHQRPEPPKVETKTVEDVQICTHVQPTADPLTYEPPPGAELLAQERARLHAQMEAQLLLTNLLVPDHIHTVSTLVNEPAPVTVNDSVKLNEAEPLTWTIEAPPSTVEREHVPDPGIVFRPRLGPTVEQQQAVFVSRIAIGVALLLTVGTLLLGYKSAVVGLGLLPAALVAWSLAAEGRRVVRLG